MNVFSVLTSIFIMIFAGLVIVRSIKAFINSSTKLAHIFNISEYTISFLLISLATSLPELVVSITSGIEKNSVLSYGNAVGSNLALLTLVVAIPVLISAPISTREIIKSKDIYYSSFFLFLALAFALDGVITRIDGFILIVGYLIYIQGVIKKITVFERILEKFEHINAWKEIVIFSASLIFLLLASEGIVRSAINLSNQLEVNLGYLGLTLTALGTSLPEIAYVISLARTKVNTEEILGDIIGSIVANSSLILGVAAVIYPINLKGTHLGFPTILFIISTLFLFLAFSKSDEVINKKEAWVLLLVYFLFLTVEFLLVI